MNYLDKWKIIEPLDKGGQGQVYRVCRKKESLEIKENITEALKMITSGATYLDPNRKESYDTFCEWLPKILWIEQFALKVLHKTQDARDPKLAKERIKREIAAMRQNLHPNLIELVDSDPDGEWFVSRFYPGGTLAQKLDAFKGDFLTILKTARPLIE